jgi:hypothetical protein
MKPITEQLRMTEQERRALESKHLCAQCASEGRAAEVTGYELECQGCKRKGAPWIVGRLVDKPATLRRKGADYMEQVFMVEEIEAYQYPQADAPFIGRMIELAKAASRAARVALDIHGDVLWPANEFWDAVRAIEIFEATDCLEDAEWRMHQEGLEIAAAKLGECRYETRERLAA